MVVVVGSQDCSSCKTSIPFTRVKHNMHASMYLHIVLPLRGCFTNAIQFSSLWFSNISNKSKNIGQKKINNDSSVGNKTCLFEPEFLRFYLQGWKHPFLIILVCLPLEHVSNNYSDTPGKTNMDAEHGRVPGEKNNSKIHVGCVYARMYFYPQIVTAKGSQILDLSRSFLPNEWRYGDTFTFKIYVNKTFRYLNCKFSHKSMQHGISYPAPGEFLGTSVDCRPDLPQPQVTPVEVLPPALPVANPSVQPIDAMDSMHRGHTYVHLWNRDFVSKYILYIP